jgi:hypothetical protein
MTNTNVGARYMLNLVPFVSGIALAIVLSNGCFTAVQVSDRSNMGDAAVEMPNEWSAQWLALVDGPAVNGGMGKGFYGHRA